ncbi:VOC family protein [Streptomyces bacillaris]|uniref:VOC family protein n=1 Tax=Streptomyces bacillaris TaxID=68179 RepID=UPI00334A4514
MTTSRDHRGEPAEQAVDPDEGMVVFWHLRTPDTDAARAFYSELFGWDFQEINHLTFAVRNRGQMIGCLLAEKERSEVPGSVLFVQVADVPGTLERAERLGGELVTPPMNIGGTQAFAELRDPTGTTFGLWTQSWGI